MMAFVRWGVDPDILHLGSFSLKYYSLCWLLAVACSYWVLARIYDREGIEHARLLSLAWYVVVGTILGARLGHCLFYEGAYYLSHPLEIILPFRKIDGAWTFTGYAGLASHGAAIGIVVAILLYARKFKAGVWETADKLGIVAPLGGALIRLGNLMNSEIIGMPADVPWAFVFSRVDSVPRHPSQLYEALCYLIIFVFIILLYKKRGNAHRSGFFFALSISSIFAVRILVEYTKEVQESFELALRHSTGFDMGQLLSLPFVVAGVILMIVFRKPKEVIKIKKQ
jgi:prolipoprotein diacylglyceryl transferase